MKTQKFLALLVALLSIAIVAGAQYVPGSVSIEGLARDGALRDGHPVVVRWKDAWMEGRSNVTFQVKVIGIINGVDSWGYEITHGTNASGWTEFMPRVLRKSGETYKIQVEWWASGRPLAVAESDPFTIILQKPRYVVAVANCRQFKDKTNVSVWWASKNVPTDATMSIVLTPAGSESPLWVEEVEGAYGKSHFTLENVPPGHYYVQVFYKTEYGFYGAESQSIPIRIR